MEQRDGSVDWLVAQIASAAHGVVTRRTLLEKGVSSEQIRVRLRRGSLIREYPGVYRVGHRASSVEARYLAAVLACGDHALLCARPAAYLWGLIKGNAPGPDVIALVKRRIRGVATHRVRRIDPEDEAECRGVPVTTVARTLVDLAGLLREKQLVAACNEADVKYKLTPDQVEAVLRRLPSRRGAGTLRHILHGDTPVTLSRLEDRFLGLLVKEGLPRPRTNRPAGGHRVDCRWPAHRLTVELDSYRFHRSRQAWERDRHREREAYARGDQFRRYTWGDVVENPTLMLRELRALLNLERSN